MTKIKLKSRRPYHRPGDARSDRAILVRSGALAIFRPSLDGGQQRITALAFPTEIILPEMITPASGIHVLVNSEIELMERPSHETCAAILDRSLDIAQEWLVRDTLGSTERIAHLLCEIAVRGHFKPDRVPVFTQQQLGEATAQTSVNVNRVMAELEGNRLIGRTDNPRTLSLNWDELARLGGFRPGYLS